MHMYYTGFVVTFLITPLDMKLCWNEALWGPHYYSKYRHYMGFIGTALLLLYMYYMGFL